MSTSGCTKVDQSLSAWTVQLEAKAMGKLYDIAPDDENYFKPPKRNQEDIKRSHGDRVRDRHFSKTNVEPPAAKYILNFPGLELHLRKQTAR